MNTKNWLHDAGIKKVVLLTVSLKLMALTVIAVGAIFLPFNSSNYFANFHYPPFQAPDFFTRFATWDAPHYLYLADFGYKPNLLSNAFFPLFSWLICGFGFLFLGHHFLTGLLLSNFFTVLAMVFIYSTVRELYNESVALKSCLLLLVFPTGFFLGLIYSDALFLMLAAGIFYFEMKNRRWPFLLFAFLLPLSRAIGILVMAAVLFKILTDKDENKCKKACELLFCSLLGLGVYFFIMKVMTGNAFSGFEAQSYYHMSKSVSTLFHPLDWFMNNFVRVHLSFNQPFTGALDRLCFLFYLVLAAASWRLLPNHLWVYVLVVGLVSGLSGDLTSFMRYFIVIFPLFVTMVIRFKSYLWYVVGACVIVQVLFVLLYSLNDWVA